MTTSNNYRYVEFVGVVGNELAELMEAENIDAVCIESDLCRLSEDDYNRLKEIAPAAFDGGDIIDVDVYDYICENNGHLHKVDTTSEMSGYPSGTGYAVKGFSTFEEAEQLAEKYGLTVVMLTCRDGWQFWYNKGRLIDKPELFPEDMGYNTAYCADSEEQVIEDLKGIISGLDDIECIVNLAQSCKDIIEELNTLGDDECIFTDGESLAPTEWKKVNIHPTEWIYDTHQYCVAVY